METKQVLDALSNIRKESKKRKFTQTVDLILNLKQIDLKKPEEKVDLFLQLPNPRAKQLKICALVDEELATEAKKHCEHVILNSEFKILAKNKAKLRKITKECAFFITQPHLMPEVATSFGKILGPKGKMPNPKAGCIIPPKADLKAIVGKLKNTIKVATKNDTIVKCAVGDEVMTDEQLSKNIEFVYSTVLAKLPQHENNVKSILVKMTMGSPVVIGGTK